MDRSARQFVAMLLAVVILATGCPGEAPEIVEPRSVTIGLDRERPSEPFETPAFTAVISEEDRVALGASQTVFEGEYINDSYSPTFRIDTKFFLYDESPNDVGPCVSDDVVVTNLETGQEFVAIPAGYCIENEWIYIIEGAFDYLDR